MIRAYLTREINFTWKCMLFFLLSMRIKLLRILTRESQRFEIANNCAENVVLWDTFCIHWSLILRITIRIVLIFWLETRTDFIVKLKTLNVQSNYYLCTIVKSWNSTKFDILIKLHVWIQFEFAIAHFWQIEWSF